MRNVLKTLVWNMVSLVRFVLNPLFNFQETAILCYHSISAVPFDTNILPADFELHLEMLKRRGYVFVSLADIVAWTKGERALPRKAVAFTFDDGYADFESVVLPLAHKYHAPVAVFAVGDAGLSRTSLGQKNTFLSPEALDELAKNPQVEIGYHSMTHPNLAQVAPADLQREIRAPFPARYYAYPGGNHTPEAAQALKEAGYEAAFTIRPVLVRPGIDLMYVPRTVILKGMTPRDVVRRASKASDWYYHLAHLL